MSKSQDAQARHIRLPFMTGTHVSELATFHVQQTRLELCGSLNSTLQLPVYSPSNEPLSWQGAFYKQGQAVLRFFVIITVRL